MARRPKGIRQMANYVRRVQDIYVAAHADTLLRVTLDAEKEVKINAKKQFTGRNGRRLSGRLLNSIGSGFTGDFRRVRNIKQLPMGYIGVRVPYAAIHEFGGKIEPVRAKNLWVKLVHKGRFRRMTPTDFFKERKRAELREKAQSRLLSKGLTGTRTRGRRGSSKVRRAMKLEQFAIIPGDKPNSRIAAHVVRMKRKTKITPLFALVKQVNMPARPYVRPGIQTALKFYSLKYGRSLAGLVKTRFFKFR